jgi:hypothetical protein
MRRTHALLRTALVLSVLPAGSLLAGGCGGGGSDNGQQQADSGSDVVVPVDSPSETSSGHDAGGDAGPLTIVGSDVTVYVSQVANLDASGSSGPGTLSFAWTLTSAPTGSAITTQSLQGATTAKPSFAPDVAGDFVLSLTVMGGGMTLNQTFTVHAVNAHVFYTTTKADDNAPYYEFDVVQMDGTGAHAVACRSQTLSLPGEGGVVTFPEGGAAGSGSEFLAAQAELADINLDSWEPVAGNPARAAFGQYETVGDASTAIMNLLAVTSDTTCVNVAGPIHVVTGSDPAIIQPHFSPDGSRIAYVEQRDQSTYHIATIGFDGTDYHDLGTICGSPDAGSACLPSNGGLFPARPQWVDGSHVAWISETSAGNFVFLKAADANNTTPTVLMSCTGATSPRGFAILKDGSILANYLASGSQVEDLVVFAGADGGACAMARNLTRFSAAGAYARDFSVSPDGTTVAYVQFNPPPGYAVDAGVRVGGSLYTVPVDGSQAPSPVGGTQQYAYYGPRFIAAGTHLAWNGSAPIPADASAGNLVAEAGLGLGSDGGAPAMNVVLLNGEHLVTVAQSDLDNKLYIFGGGNGGGCSFSISLCTAAPGHVPVASGPVGLAGVVGLYVLRRRRSRRSKRS